MVERRDVELLVRAKDLSSRPLRDVANALDQVSSSLNKQVEAARRGEVSYQELSDSFKQVQEASRALVQQQGLIDRFTKLREESGRLADRVRNTSVALQEYKATIEAGTTVTTKQENQLRRLETAYEKAQAALRRNAESTAAAQAQLEAVGVDTRNLVVAQEQLVASATQAGQASTVLSTAMAGYAKNAREAAQAARAISLTRQADEAIQSAQKIATAGATVREFGSNIAGSLRAIADPAGEARRTLAGLTAQVDTLAAEVASINGPVRNYSETLLQLTAAQRAAVAAAGQIDVYREQSVALRQARADFVAARAAVRDYQQQVAAAGAPSEELTRKLRQAETTLQSAARQYRAAADATRASREALREAGVDTRNLTVAQVQLEATVRKSTDAVERLNAAFTEFGSAGRGGVGVFGLSPYQVQNLGFQINDFFTQLASGTSVSQAFAQQFGQVVQVFGPGAFSAVARWVPLLAALGAALIVTIGALSRLSDTATSTRNFAANLQLLGDTVENAAAFTQIARDVERLGFAFDEARRAALLFLREGVAPSNIAASTEAAARLSRVLGIELPDAARLLARALTEGNQGFIALQEAGVRFTDEQRRAIQEANLASDAYTRQSLILSALAGRLREADEQGLGPWQRAVIAARAAWRGFLDGIGETAIFQAIKAGLDSIGSGLANIEAAAKRVGRFLVIELNPFLRLLNEGASLLRQMGLIAGAPDAPAAPPGPAAGPPAPASNSTNPAGGRTPGQQRADRELDGRMLEFRRDNRDLSPDQRAAAAREIALRQFRESFPEATLDVLTTIGDLAEIEFRRRLQDEIDRGAREAAEATRRDFAAIQNDLNNIVRVRDEAIRGIQEDVAAGAATPAQAIERIQAAADNARPALRALADEARRFRDANRGGDAVRNAALDSLVAQAERQAGALGSRQGTEAVLRTSEQEAQRLIQERQQFAQTQAALVQQGVITQGDAQTRIQAFYEQTNAALQANIAAYEEASRAAAENGAITQAAAAQNAAKVELWRTQLQFVNPELVRLRSAIESGIAQSFATGFDDAAKAIGNLIAGVSDTKTALDDLGTSALNFFANFLRAIAQAIVQMYALAAAKALVGGFTGFFGGAAPVPMAHSGGVVNGLSNTTRNAPSWWFANAPRYHTGGIVGLKPDEIPAILQRGEEVLSRNDPRNVLNGGARPEGGGDASGGMPIRNVLAVGDEEIANAMSGTPGERVVLNILRRNAPAVRQMVRG